MRTKSDFFKIDKQPDVSLDLTKIISDILFEKINSPFLNRDTQKYQILPLNLPKDPSQEEKSKFLERIKLPHGPLNKTSDTKLLEKIVACVLTQGDQCHFNYDKELNEIVLTCPLGTFNLSFLLKKANLSHIVMNDNMRMLYHVYLLKNDNELLKSAQRLYEKNKNEPVSQLPLALIAALKDYTRNKNSNSAIYGLLAAEEYQHINLKTVLLNIVFAAVALNQLEASSPADSQPKEAQHLYRTDGLHWFKLFNEASVLPLAGFVSTSTDRSNKVWDSPNIFFANRPNLPLIESASEHSNDSKLPEKEVLLPPGQYVFQQGFHRKTLAALVRSPLSPCISFNLGIQLREKFINAKNYPLLKIMRQLFYIDAIVFSLAKLNDEIGEYYKNISSEAVEAIKRDFVLQQKNSSHSDGFTVVADALESLNSFKDSAEQAFLSQLASEQKQTIKELLAYVKECKRITNPYAFSKYPYEGINPRNCEALLEQVPNPMMKEFLAENKNTSNSKEEVTTTGPVL